MTALAEERDFYHHGSGEGMDMSSGKENVLLSYPETLLLGLVLRVK